MKKKEDILRLEKKFIDYFPPKPMPKGKNLFNDLIHYHANADEIEKFEAFLLSSPWVDLLISPPSLSLLNELSEYWLSFTPVYFKYYLPLYLLVVAKYYDLSDILADIVLKRFSYREGMREHIKKEMIKQESLLRKIHYKTIYSFLKHMEKYHGEDFACPFMSNPIDSSKQYVLERIYNSNS